MGETNRFADRGNAPAGVDHPLAASDVLAFTADRGALQLLLVKRRWEPFRDCWAIPGSFIGAGESAEDAAARAFREKTGISNIYMEQLYTFSGARRDPRMRVLSVAYLAMAPKSRLAAAVAEGGGTVMLFAMRPGADGAFELVPEDPALPAVPSGALAFDHAEIICTARARMAGKLDYTDIGFEFLEDRGRFTLSELYDVYTAISDRPYDLPNFRRFIKKRYEETGRIEPTGEKLKKRGTPAVVYRWKEDDPWKRY